MHLVRDGARPLGPAEQHDRVGDLQQRPDFALSNGAPITVIGTDAGLLPAPVQVSSYRHGMAERYDVVIDVSRFAVGTRITLLTPVHEDHDMMDQFEIQPGATTTAPPATTTPTGPGTVKGKPAMAPMMMVQWELQA